MFISDIASKAQDLLNKAVTRKTKVYDASKNKITVGLLQLDGVIEASVSQKTVTRAEQGIDTSYYTYYDVEEPLTLSVTLLPTAKANDILKALAVKQKKLKGFIRLEVHENGNIIDQFRGHLISLPEIQMSIEAGNRTYVFGVVSESGIDFSVNDVTEVEESTETTQQAVNQNLEESNIAEDSVVTKTPLQWEKGM